jgi:hypothetical protein
MPRLSAARADAPERRSDARAPPRDRAESRGETVGHASIGFVYFVLLLQIWSGIVGVIEGEGC